MVRMISNSAVHPLRTSDKDMDIRRSRRRQTRATEPLPVLREAKEQETRRHNVFGETITASLFYGVSKMAMWRILKE